MKKLWYWLTSKTRCKDCIECTANNNQGFFICYRSYRAKVKHVHNYGCLYWEHK